MKGKLLFATGLATGYVLGSKAGRQAYERIKLQANDFWESPAVQKTVSQAGTLAKETASTAQAKVTNAMGKAADKVADSAEGSSGTSENAGDSSTGDSGSSAGDNG